MEEEHFKTICRSQFPGIEFFRSGDAVIAQLPHGNSLTDMITLGTKNGAIAMQGIMYSVDAPTSHSSLACSPKPVTMQELVDKGYDTGYTQEELLTYHLKRYKKLLEIRKVSCRR